MLQKEYSIKTLIFLLSIVYMSSADELNNYIQHYILNQNQTIHLKNPQPPMPSISPLEEHFERQQREEYNRNWSKRKETGYKKPPAPVDTFNSAPIDPNSEVGQILQSILDTTHSHDSGSIENTVKPFNPSSIVAMDIEIPVDTAAIQREKEIADSIRLAEEKAKDARISRSLQRYYIQYEIGVLVSRMRGDAIDEFERKMDDITPIASATQSLLIHRAMTDFLSIGTGFRFSKYGVHVIESFFIDYDERYEFNFFQSPIILTFSNFNPESFTRRVHPFFSCEFTPSFLLHTSAAPYMYEPDEDYYYNKYSYLDGFNNGTDDDEMFRTFNLFTALGGGIRIRLGNRVSFDLKTSYELSLLSAENIDDQTRDNFSRGTFSESTSRFHAFKFAGGISFRFK